MSPAIANLIGYIASALVVGSFMLKDLRKVRIINLLGCIFFVLYGVFSGMLWPIIIPNVVLSGVQIYNLVKKH